MVGKVKSDRITPRGQKPEPVEKKTLKGMMILEKNILNYTVSTHGQGTR